MKFVEGGICAPKGFQGAGVHCGIRGAGEKKDLSLIVRSRSEERRVGKECRSRWSPYH